MSRSIGSVTRCAVAVMATMALFALPAAAQTPVSKAVSRVQPNDEEYTKKIRELLTDPRISTELVDHLPASATVPTPLKFLGRVIGQPGELTHAKDIHRYMEAVAKASGGRAKVWSIGKTEEGREMIIMAIADAATIAQLDKYKGMLKQLTDPRKTTEAQAQALMKTAKPIYWVTSGMHSPETGGPEMLMEMAYRLVVENTPFISNIRDNVITFITPVIEVDGREKMVDTYYYNKKFGANGRLPLMYWGKYVQHDNNRDGMGQFLDLTKNTTKAFLEWTPTVLHDLHEAQTYLYASTGEGPYNEAVDAITVDEWWILAKNDVSEMTKRGVPGVWTYGFYDGWAPNYMFFIANSHNSIGRFYEVASYGPENRTMNGGAAANREWFRPNPALPTISWGPRANTNIQQSALLFSLSRMAKDREMFLENYWIKNKRAVAKGRNSNIAAWVIPAGQQQKANVAEAVNDLRTQGLEFHIAAADYQAGPIAVKAGDYIVRGDQPYRTLADMYFQIQNYSLANPSPYDDTGWTFPMMRNLVVTAIGDKAILDQRMTAVMTPARAPGGIAGTGDVVIVDHSGDNNLVSFRFRFASLKMSASEVAFDAAGHRFNAGSFIIPAANRAALEPVLRELGLSAWAVSSVPSVPSHELVTPRIGYIHSWSSTQDEGWVRAAFDHYGVPYNYFGENLAKDGNLRAKYDVIVYPHGGGGRGGGGFGGATVTTNKVPFKKTAEFPSLGYPDSTDDVGGGLGPDGLKALYQFVQQGGTLITEGSTSNMMVTNALAAGVTVDPSQGLVADGTILRGILTDKKSPLLYGYPDRDLPVYFNSSPIFNVGQPAVTMAPSNVRYQNTTPMASRLPMSGWDPTGSGIPYGATSAPDTSAGAAGGRGGGGRGGAGGAGGAGAGGRGGAGGGAGGRGGGGAAAAPQPPEGLFLDPNSTPRVVLSFPAKASDMLLSGVLSGGDVLANRAQLIDQSIGQGHLVMFAIRPFWRWQTQGTYSLGFNAIVHWNHLSAGK